MPQTTRPTRIRTLLSLLLLSLVLSPAWSGEARSFGKGVSGGETVRIGELLSEPGKYVGKTVRVSGKISDVCPRAGCWIDIREEAGGKVLRFKVEDGVMVFPVALKGKDVVAEGVLEKRELSKEESIAEARHEAEEAGKEFDPASVTGPLVQYRLKGQGAVVR